LPETDAVPTVVPPEVHVPGADACGPKVVKVIVPVALELEDNVAVIALAAMAVPAVPLDGPEVARTAPALATTVSDIPEPHVEVAALLFPSPL